MAEANVAPMDSICLNSQALSFDMLGKGFVAQSTRQAIIGDQKFSEVDPIQAAAIKELTKSGENPRYGPQAVGSLPSVGPAT